MHRYFANKQLDRRERKREKDAYRLQLKKRPGSTCPYCGKQMTWCESCQVYTSVCCIQYGTCMCS